MDNTETPTETMSGLTSRYDTQGPAVALTKCYFCGESNEILLQCKNILFKDRRIEQMNGKVYSMNPCNKCQDLMKQGVILITIDEEKSGPSWNVPPNDPEERKHWMPNPWRTGGWFVVKDKAIKRLIKSGPLADWAIGHRWMFISHHAAECMGLFAESERMNRENKDNQAREAKQS